MYSNEEEPCPCDPAHTVPSLSFKFNSMYDLVMYKLLSNRTLVLHGEVCQDTMLTLCRQLIYLSLESKDPIYIVLNSVGGEVYSGLLIFDTIRGLVNTGIEVYVEVRGLAASMGTILVQAATERIATKHTRFLIHEISSWMYGKTSEVEEHAQEVKKINKMLNEIIAERSGKTADEIQALIKKKDYWMSAEEALEFGLIDTVI